MPRIIEHQIRVLNRPSSPPFYTPAPSAHSTEFGRCAELQRDKSWTESPFERSDTEMPQQKRRSTFSGGEETFGVESFERNLRYSPYEVDRQHFGVRTFEEKVPLRVGNGTESVRNGVKFEEDQPSEQNHLLSRSAHLNTTPIRIPRIRSTGRAAQETCAARSTPSSCDSPSDGLPSSLSPVPHPVSTVAATQRQKVPMKKVIRRSRLVSVHDGRPIGPYSETVHYEPTIIGRYCTSADEGKGRSLSRRRITRSGDQWRGKGSSPSTAMALWKSSSSASSLSSNDEREGKCARKNGGRGKEGTMGRGEWRTAGWTRREAHVQVQHNPLFYCAGHQFCERRIGRD